MRTTEQRNHIEERDDITDEKTKHQQTEKETITDIHPKLKRHFNQKKKMNRKEASKLEAEMRELCLSGEEEGATACGAPWAAAEQDDETEDTDSAPEGIPEDADHLGAEFGPSGPFGAHRRHRGCPNSARGPMGMGPFGRRRCGAGGPFGGMGPMGRHNMMGGPMGGPRSFMGGHPMGGPMGFAGGPMGGPMGFMGSYNMGGPMTFMGGHPFSTPMGFMGGPMGEPMGGPGMGPFGPWGPGCKHFGGPDKFRRGPPPFWCESKSDDTHASGDEKEARRQKRRQQKKAATTESSGDENEAGDVTLPPWVARFMRLKQRLATADDAEKEQIRRRMRHLAMKRFGQQHQGQTPCWGPSCRRGPPFMGRFQSETEDTDTSAEEKEARRQKRRQQKKAAAAAAAAESSGDENKASDVTLPPWVARFMRLKQRLATADDAEKEQIRRRMRHLVKKRFAMGHHQGGQSPCMGPPFTGPWWMTSRSAGHRVRGRRCWESADSGSDENTHQTAQQTKLNHPEAKCTDGEQTSDEDFELPANLPPWMVHVIKMKKRAARARGCDVRKRQRGWARRSAPWWAMPGGAPGGAAFRGPPGPAFFWAMQQQQQQQQQQGRPGVWRHMMKQHRRATRAHSNDSKVARCQHCGHCSGATN